MIYFPFFKFLSNVFSYLGCFLICPILNTQCSRKIYTIFDLTPAVHFWQIIVTMFKILKYMYIYNTVQCYCQLFTYENGQISQKINRCNISAVLFPFSFNTCNRSRWVILKRNCNNNIFHCTNTLFIYLTISSLLSIHSSWKWFSSLRKYEL